MRHGAFSLLLFVLSLVIVCPSILPSSRVISYILAQTTPLVKAMAPALRVDPMTLSARDILIENTPVKDGLNASTTSTRDASRRQIRFFIDNSADHEEEGGFAWNWDVDSTTTRIVSPVSSSNNWIEVIRPEFMQWQSDSSYPDALGELYNQEQKEEPPSFRFYFEVIRKGSATPPNGTRSSQGYVQLTIPWIPNYNIDPKSGKLAEKLTIVFSEKLFVFRIDGNMRTASTNDVIVADATAHFYIQLDTQNRPLMLDPFVVDVLSLTTAGISLLSLLIAPIDPVKVSQAARILMLGQFEAFCAHAADALHGGRIYIGPLAILQHPLQFSMGPTLPVDEGRIQYYLSSMICNTALTFLLVLLHFIFSQCCGGGNNTIHDDEGTADVRNQNRKNNDGNTRRSPWCSFPSASLPFVFLLQVQTVSSATTVLVYSQYTFFAILTLGVWFCGPLVWCVAALLNVHHQKGTSKKRVCLIPRQFTPNREQREEDSDDISKYLYFVLGSEQWVEKEPENEEKAARNPNEERLLQKKRNERNDSKINSQAFRQQHHHELFFSSYHFRSPFYPTRWWIVVEHFVNITIGVITGIQPLEFNTFHSLAMALLLVYALYWALHLLVVRPYLSWWHWIWVSGLTFSLQFVAVELIFLQSEDRQVIADSTTTTTTALRIHEGLPSLLLFISAGCVIFQSIMDMVCYQWAQQKSERGNRSVRNSYFLGVYIGQHDEEEEEKARNTSAPSIQREQRPVAADEQKMMKNTKVTQLKELLRQEQKAREKERREEKHFLDLVLGEVLLQKKKEKEKLSSIRNEEEEELTKKIKKGKHKNDNEHPWKDGNEVNHWQEDPKEDGRMAPPLLMVHPQLYKNRPEEGEQSSGWTDTHMSSSSSNSMKTKNDKREPYFLSYDPSPMGFLRQLRRDAEANDFKTFLLPKRNVEKEFL